MAPPELRLMSTSYAPLVSADMEHPSFSSVSYAMVADEFPTKAPDGASDKAGFKFENPQDRHRYLLRATTDAAQHRWGVGTYKLFDETNHHELVGEILAFENAPLPPPGQWAQDHRELNLRGMHIEVDSSLIGAGPAATQLLIRTSKREIAFNSEAFDPEFGEMVAANVTETDRVTGEQQRIYFSTRKDLDAFDPQAHTPGMRVVDKDHPALRDRWPLVHALLKGLCSFKFPGCAAPADRGR